MRDHNDTTLRGRYAGYYRFWNSTDLIRHSWAFSSDVWSGLDLASFRVVNYGIRGKRVWEDLSGMEALRRVSQPLPPAHESATRQDRGAS